MWKILLSEFWSDLKTQKTRAFLTMFAITWGTISVVLLLAFGAGLGQKSREGFMNAGDRVLIVYGGETSVPFEGLPKGRPIRLRADDLELLTRSIEGIDMVSPSYGRWGVLLQVGENKTTTYMEGVDPAFEEMRRMFPASGGRFLNTRDVESKRRVLFLGDEIAKQLFGDVEPVGETVEIDGLPFTVCGVMRKKLQTAMNNGPDADRAIIPSSVFETVYGHRYVNHMIIRPRDAMEHGRIKQRIYEVLGSRYKFDPTDERALGVWDFIEEEKAGARIFMGIQIFLGVVGGFTLALAGVGVANIMYVTVRERTREFGVKLAIGARKSHIKTQVVFEALLLCLSGGLLGLLFSWGVVTAVSGIPNKEGATEFLANPQMSSVAAITTVVILTVIGLVSGYFPARKASSVDPVESLRYE
jgi:putative ABC transport system permease protein